MYNLANASIYFYSIQRGTPHVNLRQKRASLFNSQILVVALIGIFGGLKPKMCVHFSKDWRSGIYSDGAFVRREAVCLFFGVARSYRNEEQVRRHSSDFPPSTKPLTPKSSQSFRRLRLQVWQKDDGGGRVPKIQSHDQCGVRDLHHVCGRRPLYVA